MSQWLMIVLRDGHQYPDDLVPEGQGYGGGYILPQYVGELSRACERLGLTPLGDFIVDDHARLKTALRERGWVEVDPIERAVEVTGVAPTDAPYIVHRQDERGVWKRYMIDYEHTPESLAAEAEHDRIEAEVEATSPWFDPEDGLRTIRGLIAMIEEARSPDSGRKLDARSAIAGIGLITGDDDDLALVYLDALCDLKTFELQLEYAARVGVPFQTYASY